MPGMTGPAWLDDTDLPKSPGGLIQVDAQCRGTGWERFYGPATWQFSGAGLDAQTAHIADL